MSNKDQKEATLHHLKKYLKKSRLKRIVFLNQLKTLPQRIKENEQMKRNSSQNKIIDLGILYMFEVVDEIKNLSDEEKFQNGINNLIQMFEVLNDSCSRDQQIVQEIISVHHFGKRNETNNILYHRFLCELLMEIRPKQYKIGAYLYFDQFLTQFQRAISKISNLQYRKLIKDKISIYNELSFPNQKQIQHQIEVPKQNENVIEIAIKQQQQNELSSFFQEGQKICEQKIERNSQIIQKQYKIQQDNYFCILKNKTKGKIQKEKKKKNQSMDDNQYRQDHNIITNIKTQKQFKIEQSNSNELSSYMKKAQQKILSLPLITKKKEKQLKNERKEKKQKEKEKAKQQLKQKFNDVKKKIGKKKKLISERNLEEDESDILSIQSKNEVQNEQSLEEDSIESLRKERLRIFKFHYKDPINGISLNKINANKSRWDKSKRFLAPSSDHIYFK